MTVSARAQNLLEEVGVMLVAEWAADGAKKMPLSSLPWPRRVHFAGQGPSCVDTLEECNVCVFQSSGFRNVFVRPPSSVWHRGSHPISARGFAGCMCF